MQVISHPGLHRQQLCPLEAKAKPRVSDCGRRARRQHAWATGGEFPALSQKHSSFSGVQAAECTQRVKVSFYDEVVQCRVLGNKRLAHVFTACTHLYFRFWLASPQDSTPIG